MSAQTNETKAREDKEKSESERESKKQVAERLANGSRDWNSSGDVWGVTRSHGQI